jgi:hypothetical protein
VFVTTPPHSEPIGPIIVESYREYSPPVKFRHDIETLLRHVPPKYLVGLKTIVLTNRAGLTRDKRKQKVWSRNRMVRLADAFGSYSSASKSSPATVWLYVDNIAKSQDKWWEWFGLPRYLTSGQVLYHEIGHHIHSVHKPIHEGPENVAEGWSNKLMGNFLRKHYRYSFPLLHILVRWVLPVLKRVRRPKHALKAD